jgi:proteasome assembly chaperone (PAC2) family protein
MHAALKFESLPSMPGGTLLLALTGWMDGGDVSTGTVKQLMENHPTREIARIEPGGFYIDNFPGSMEIAALFRPEVKYKNGIITRYVLTENVFHADEARNMIFFLGREPNIDWIGFSQAIFDLAAATGVTKIVFMGSFGGTTPHTREPRMFGSVSAKKMLPTLKKFRMTPSTYEGPASFASLLLHQAPQHNIEMISLAAEIPGYLQGHNPLSIEAVTRRLAAMLEIEVDLESLRRASTAWELQVTEAVEKDEELQERVKKLEEAYDNELIEHEAE